MSIEKFPIFRSGSFDSFEQLESRRGPEDRYLLFLVFLPIFTVTKFDGIFESTEEKALGTLIDEAVKEAFPEMPPHLQESMTKMYIRDFRKVSQSPRLENKLYAELRLRLGHEPMIREHVKNFMDELIMVSEDISLDELNTIHQIEAILDADD